LCEICITNISETSIIFLPLHPSVKKLRAIYKQIMRLHNISCKIIKCIVTYADTINALIITIGIEEMTEKKHQFLDAFRFGSGGYRIRTCDHFRLLVGML